MALRYKLEIAFDGTNYHGWQIQQNANTVQQVINDSISTIIGEKIESLGCGRTDTGVHASQFFLHFDTEKNIDKEFLYKLNRLLPSDIVAKKIAQVAEIFHARFSAIERKYIYYITFEKNPFNYLFESQNSQFVNVQRMNQAAVYLLGIKSFQSFCKGVMPEENYMCTILEAKWIKTETGLQFHIRANRFLRGMVRAIVGTLLDVGKEKISPLDFKKIIDGKKRELAGQNVEAKGLFLVEIKY